MKHTHSMNLLRALLLAAVPTCTLLATPLAAAVEPREVAEQFDRVLRKSHETAITKYELSTCPYKLEQSSMRCAEKPRVSVLENVLKYYGDDIRSTAIILEPARDRGIGTLSYEYYDTRMDNATWIYLSAMGKVKRIISTQDSDDSGSFFGSEFYIEDMDYKKLDEYNFKILGEEEFEVLEVGGYVKRPAWILEWTPTPERVRKTKYAKIVTRIDKERHILLKEEYYNQNQQLFKERTVKNVELIDKHWMPRQITMNNLAARRVSLMDRQSIAFNGPVPDEFLTQRTLTDHAFRERYLNQFRTAWK